MFKSALKMDSSQVSNGQFAQVVGVRSLYPTTNSYWASYVDWCSVFGLVLARPSPNKVICLLAVFFISCEVETKYCIFFPFYSIFFPFLFNFFFPSPFFWCKSCCDGYPPLQDPPCVDVDVEQAHVGAQRARGIAASEKSRDRETRILTFKWVKSQFHLI